jgi:hypothetical protein
MTDDLPLWSLSRLHDSETSAEGFAIRHSRLHGEPTSYMAAMAIAGHTWAQCGVLWDLLKKAGPLTCDEADTKLEGDHWKRTTAGRRMADLVREGLVEFTGETRKTRSGRRANVYRVKVNKSEAA